VRKWSDNGYWTASALFDDNTPSLAQRA
jgi:hypothetical protein